MPKPVIAIIGRPNVGKSTLFNRMVGGAKAIVEPTEGVTRDRNYSEAEWEGRGFIAIDTGGFYPEAAPGQEIFAQVKEQAMFAAEEADLVIHLLDAKAGLTPSDEAIAGMLRERGGKAKILWAANKIDGSTKDGLLYDFFRLGVNIVPVSATSGYGFEEFMEAVMGLLPEAKPEKNKKPSALKLPNVAVVGRPNVGKSTLINSLLAKKRLIVSPLPGTTRDSIDTECIYYGKKYLFIDTAGIKRKSRAYDIERYSMIRSLRSIERCDVALLVLDAQKGIVTEDQKIAGLIHGHGKGAVFLLNKWDLVPEPAEALKKLTAEIQRKIWFFEHAPIITTSGLVKKRITKLFPLIDEVITERRKKIPPDKLVELLKGALKVLHPPVHKGKRLRVSALRQLGVEPPVFAIYADEPAALKPAFLRYFERLLRERFSFRGTPVIILKRKR